MTKSTVNTETAVSELKATFRRAAMRMSKAENFRLLIDAVCVKIDKSTESVAKQTIRHANSILNSVGYLESINAVESVNAFFASAKNIKAIAYISELSKQKSNNYLSLTMRHIAAEKSATTETVARMLAKAHYTEATASAQKSMSVNALRAMRAIDFADTSKAAISKAENFDAIKQICDAFAITRKVTA